MTDLPKNNVICLAIDRLHAGYLGAYGNAWISTPALDRLAAEAFVQDRAIIDSPRLDVFYRSVWQGLHAMSPTVSAAGHKSLFDRMADSGRQTILLTDELSVAELPAAAAFGQRVVLKSAANSPVVADSEDGTQAAEFFAAAAEKVQEAQSPFFLWLHTGTLGRIWDAPIEFREQYRDEDDPPSENWAVVPNRLLSERFDPDELLAITHAYAGQVTLVDQLVGSLLASIDDAGLNQNTLFLLVSSRGFPLGEHRRVGACDDALYAELTHVPWMLRFPDGLGAADRSEALVQPADLPATILAWLGLNTPDASAAIAGHGRSLLPLFQGCETAEFDRACIVAGPDQKRIVTPAWSLRISNQDVRAGERHSAKADDEEASPRTELFAKPDDWFEVNELSNRCPEVVELLQVALTEFETACASGTPAVLSKLPSELIHGIE